MLFKSIKQLFREGSETAYFRRIRIISFALFFFTLVLVNAIPVASSGNSEELNYSMKFNGKSTAYSILKFTQPDSTTLEISWLLKTKAAYKLLFAVNNRYQSFINTSTGLPDKLYKEIKQKNIKQSWRTDYDRGRLLAETDTGLQWPIQSGCLDILSLIWTCRNRELTPGDTLAYLLDIESHLWKLHGRVSAAIPQLDSPVMPCYRQIDFTFSPSLPVEKRAWKTDLLTNRISRADTKLTIGFAAPPDNTPVYIKFINSDNTVEMLLDKKSLSKTP